jgi:YihY family inner membrane protein
MSRPEPGVGRRSLRRVDRIQRRRPMLAFPVAVVKKFGDDRAGQLAALIAYYGFFSLFPLLLAFATLVAIAVRDDPGLRRELLDSALRQFPVVGTRIRESIGELSGSPFALVVGTLGALWSGTAVVTAAQHAMDEVWDVPRTDRPAVWIRLLRAVLLFVAFGTAIVVTAVLGGLGAGSGAASGALRLLAAGASLAVTAGILAVAYRVLTTADVGWRHVLPGALLASAAWGALLLAGGWLVDHWIRNASQAYGFFKIVIGLLTWIFLLAQVFVAAAEVNVVRARRLWPRSLLDPPLNDQDRRSLGAQAREQRAKPEERVEVRFEDHAAGGGRP